MKRVCVRILLCALLLLLPARQARADDEGGVAFLFLLIPIAAGIIVGAAIDVGAMLGGTVSMFGTAVSLRDEQPDETWRDASLGFGAITIACGGIWMGIAAGSDWDGITTGLAAAHLGVGAVNIALAIASHAIGTSTPTLVPVAGTDVHHQPFIGAGIELAKF